MDSFYCLIFVGTEVGEMKLGRAERVEKKFNETKAFRNRINLILLLLYVCT